MPSEENMIILAVYACVASRSTPLSQGNNARPIFWIVVVRPNAVPTRFFSTMSGIDGHIAAGTMTNAAPRTIIGIAGGIIVNAIIRNAGTMRMEPPTMTVARLPYRSTNCPKNGAKTMEANMMIVVVPPAVLNM